MSGPREPKVHPIRILDLRPTQMTVGMREVDEKRKRFAEQGKKVITLDDCGCLCTTMFRISPQHLAWALENLLDGNVVNRIRVAEDVKYWAKVALDRMLSIKPAPQRADPAAQLVETSRD